MTAGSDVDAFVVFVLSDCGVAPGVDALTIVVRQDVTPRLWFSTESRPQVCETVDPPVRKPNFIAVVQKPAVAKR